jgi:type I restriction enzyme S subunit
VSWRETTLGEILTLKRGYDLAARDRRPGPYPIISSSGITDWHADYKVKGPGVVTGRYGTLGQVFFEEGDFWPLNTSLYVQDFKGTYPRFAAYLLSTLNLSAQSGAAAVPGINRNHLHNLPVEVPTPNLQRRIADILSSYDDLIENNSRRIAIFDDVAQRLFEEWFVRPIRKLPIPGDRLSEWSLPDGWAFSPLGNISSVTMGQSPPSSEYNRDGTGMPFHQGVTEFAGYFHGTDLFCNSPERYRTAREGDILFSVRAPVGRIALALHSLVIGRGLSAIRATSIEQSYLLAHLKSQFSTTDMFGSGTIYKSITKDDLLTVPILVPDCETLKRFAHIADDCLASIRSLHLANTNLCTTRDLLLPKLISGEIEARAAEETLDTAVP